MRVCDICKKDDVKYNTTAVVKDDGTVKKLELCERCYFELNHREADHRYAAYQETVKAVGGEIPRKSHWWNVFSW